MSTPDRRSAAPGWWRELRRAASWHRRLLSAGLLAAAVAVGLHALAPPPPDTTQVLVAREDLAGGITVGSDDVEVVGLPTDAVPETALRSVGEAHGRTLVGPVNAGEVVTDVRLLGPSYLDTLDGGVVAAPVRLADAHAARLLRPGDIVDVLAAAAPEPGASTAEASVVADSVRVVTVPLADSGGFGGEVGDGGLVVLATPTATASRLAAAAVTSRLTVTLVQ